MMESSIAARSMCSRKKIIVAVSHTTQNLDDCTTRSLRTVKCFIDCDRVKNIGKLVAQGLGGPPVAICFARRGLQSVHERVFR